MMMPIINRILKFIFSCFVLLTTNVGAQTWNAVGSLGFTEWGVQFPAIAVDGVGTPYIVYSDSNSGGPASVMKYDGNNWVFVGSPRFSSSIAYYTSIAISGTTVYVAYEDLGYDGKVTVMKYDTIASSWVNVGSPGFSAGDVNFTSIAIDKNGIPYVAYQDWGNGTRATVMKFNGLSWVTVGSAGISPGWAETTSIALDTSGTPYVSYVGANGTGSSAVTVKKFNGSDWATVGSAHFSPANALQSTIAVDRAGTPYVAYTDGGYLGPASVMKFNGTSWVNVGSPGFSPGSASHVGIKVTSNGTPVVAFGDGADKGRAMVMEYSGSVWAAVGNPDFSDSAAAIISLALDPNDNPYVAYADLKNGQKISVMTAGAVNSIKNVSNKTGASIDIYPIPATTSLTITSPDKITPITITNLIGQTVYTQACNTGQVQVNVASFPAGMYFVKVNDGVVRKFVKE